MMSETVVTIQDASTNANNPRGPTIKSEPGQPNFIAGLTINIPYFKTIPGIIKLAQAVLGIFCSALASGAYSQFLMTFSTLAFVATFIWIVVYLCSIRESLRVPINWMLTEFINTAGWTVLLALSVIWHLIARTSFIGATIFGILDMLAYAAGTYFLWLEWKNTEAQ
ncbi:hypothetical protein HCN44_000227 [Aphidius gifuensis]|uniref:MARVEL domain-containing protein n=1 Tax=Aphidius gifuensis TaxID=684658 RepID=A0A835CNM7_APHGI|nr:hypothetical protein HCN44_000227 [Aphidius gifuensis]